MQKLPPIPSLLSPKSPPSSPTVTSSLFQRKRQYIRTHKHPFHAFSTKYHFLNYQFLTALSLCPFLSPHLPSPKYSSHLSPSFDSMSNLFHSKKKAILPSFTTEFLEKEVCICLIPLPCLFLFDPLQQQHLSYTALLKHVSNHQGHLNYKELWSDFNYQMYISDFQFRISYWTDLQLDELQAPQFNIIKTDLQYPLDMLFLLSFPVLTKGNSRHTGHQLSITLSLALLSHSDFEALQPLLIPCPATSQPCDKVTSLCVFPCASPIIIFPLAEISRYGYVPAQVTSITSSEPSSKHPPVRGFSYTLFPTWAEANTPRVYTHSTLFIGPEECLLPCVGAGHVCLTF